MVELNLNRDTVRFIIDAAREFHAREDVTFPDDEDDQDDGLWQQIATDFSEDTYYQELKNTINDLEPDQQISLVALMWLGRGDYMLDEWQEAVEFAEESWTKHTAEYLIGTALLADYLEGGLEEFDTGE